MAGRRHISGPRKARVTLLDVARTAGVSPSTASRALNGGSRTSDGELAIRVRAAAEDLGYVPHQIARALRGRRTGIIVFADDPSNLTVGAVIRAMEHVAADHGVLVAGVPVGTDPETNLALVRTVRSLRPVAIVISSSRLTNTPSHAAIAAELVGFRDDGGAVVVTGNTDLPFAAVEFADFDGAYDLGTHMATLDRNRFAILAGEPDNGGMQDRSRGFLRAIADAGHRPDLVIIEHCRHSRDSASAAMTQLLTTDPRPDVVLCGNDLIALGALAAAHAQGLHVPADIALSGIDDIPLASDTVPDLTTLAHPFEEVGTIVARMAMDPTSGPQDTIQVRGQLRVRGSSRV